MKVIGLTGGIGSGKSTVADLLRKRGWEVVASDDTSKEVLGSGAVREELEALFGLEVYKDGVVDRGLISAQVFGDDAESKTKLQKLNAILHPRVLDAHLALIEERMAAGSPLITIESALIYEVGLEDGFDWVIVVDAKEEVCIARAMDRLKLTEQQVRSRIAEQMPASEKRGLADFVIENNGSMNDLSSAVDTIAIIIELLPEQE